MASTTAKPKYRVLFCDTFVYRHPQFRVRSTEHDVIQRHAHNLTDFKAALTEALFDVIFIPGYLNTPVDTVEMVQLITNLPVKPRLVVMHGTSLTDGAYLLNHAKISNVWIPWEFTNPGLHTRKKIKES